MAIIKCKMCGGELNYAEGSTVAECDYCGSKQTIPNQDNEKKLTLFARADRLRRVCEFDKAAGVYKSIVTEFPEEAEAYWGLVLCRYGIEYVDDPSTGKKVPICHRFSFDSILEDTDFEQACENTDAIARRLYRDEAKAIEDIRRGILEVSSREEPYDIFICYKETDENGERTIDSVIAQDVYEALAEKGYQVFFSRISLEEKLGTEYEPYIFAALHSARIMLVFGTDYEYFNAVWIKNEWSRFLSLIAAGQKKTLIPCFKGIDAYDMPKEFARLQAQDLGKVGAIQDLLRGIDKIMDNSAMERPQETATEQRDSGEANMEVLLKRGYMALEDSKWVDAMGFFDRVLDLNPESALAYLGMAMAQAKCGTEEEFQERYISLAWKKDRNTARAKQYATPEIQAKFESWDAEKTANAAKRFEMKQIYAQQRKRLAPVATRICVGPEEKYGYFVGLNSDGTVVAAGNNEWGQCNVSNWTDIVAIASGGNYTIGLKEDGTVVIVGYTGKEQCDVRDWTDIVAIAAGWSNTFGLKVNGTVVAVGDNEWGQCNVCDWTDIVAIAAGFRHIVGLKSNGTVVATGDDRFNSSNVSNWTDIVAIYAIHSQTVGLRADGTVIAVGGNLYDQCNISNWTDIVAIAAGNYHTVGLKTDGTVVAVGRNYNGECDVSDWTDIVAIAAGDGSTAGLKSDGTVVSTYHPNWVGAWKLFDNIETIELELAQAEEKRRQENELRVKRRNILNNEKLALQAELNGLRGLFTGGRRKEIETRLTQIETELKKL